MTITVSRIVLVEYPGVFEAARPAIVTAVYPDLSIDVTAFGVGEKRGDGLREYRQVEFHETIEEAHDTPHTGPFAYYPPRVVTLEQEIGGE